MNLILKPGDLAALPDDPARLFGREAPLALEIGFGGGRFLTHLAEARPAWNVLGVELSGGSMTRAFKRLRRAGARNVRLFRGDGRFVARDVLPPGSLHRVYANFPSPWPKKKHRDRRLLRAPFFRLLASRLASAGGALHLTTDHERYFRSAVRAARSTDLYRMRFTPPPHAALGTKYARRWQDQGRTIRHVAFFSENVPPFSFPPVIEPTPMHHAILQGDLPDLAEFEKIVRQFDGGTVVVLNAYRAVNETTYLFLTLVEEEHLRQKVLIEARPSENGVFVGLKPFGDALSTEGTSEAVDCVTAWLCERGLTVEEALY